MNASSAVRSSLRLTVGGVIFFLLLALFYGPVPWLLVLVVWCVVVLLVYPFVYVHVAKIDFDPPDYLIRLAYQ